MSVINVQNFIYALVNGTITLPNSKYKTVIVCSMSA